MIDRAIQKMVKEFHPQLRAVWWGSAYYVMWDDDVKRPFSFSIGIWKPVLLRLDQPNWYDKFAVKTKTGYKLRPEYETATDILNKLTTLAKDINKLDDRIRLDIYPNALVPAKSCHSLSMRAWLPFEAPEPAGARATWHKQIFLHPDDCHNLISPTTGYLLTSLRDTYEHLRTKHEPEAMREMALRQAHNENASGSGPAPVHDN
jgi:hypothetical protein